MTRGLLRMCNIKLILHVRVKLAYSMRMTIVTFEKSTPKCAMKFGDIRTQLYISCSSQNDCAEKCTYDNNENNMKTKQHFMKRGEKCIFINDAIL